MPLKIICQHCGKELLVPETEAGLSALCNACGGRFVVPWPQSAGASDALFDEAIREAQAAAGAGASAARVDAALEAAGVIAPPGVSSRTAPRADATPSMPTLEPPVLRWPYGPGSHELHDWGRAVRWATIIAGTLCLLGLGLATWLASRHGPPPQPQGIAGAQPASWESVHREALLAQHEQARATVVRGDLRAAYALYEHLLATVGDRSIQDAALRRTIDAARAEKQRVFELVLEELRRRQLAAAAEPVAPPGPPAGDAPPAATAPVAMAPTPSPAGKGMTVVRSPRPEDPVTDERVGRAIQRGANWLVGQFTPQHVVQGAGRREADAAANALDALCVYALLQSGLAVKDARLEVRGEFMRRTLDALRELPMPAGAETYGRSLRAGALALADRRGADRAVLRQDAGWLLNMHRRGAYDYSKPNDSQRWDNSNSQYGLLGVWAAAEVGAAEVPGSYWRTVERHWAEAQQVDGRWGYTGAGGGDARLSMTVAGIASLFVTHDYLEAPQFGNQVGREPLSKPLALALAWLEQGSNAVTIDSQWGYTLFGVERVGLASGFKYFGTHDWYRELGRQVLERQQEDGSWGDAVETSFALLFLSRGRHPILMNKLRFDGHWANRPRDAANLARFTSRELERPLNWQVVALANEWHDWLDAPILSLASHEPLTLSGHELNKLRYYVENGGLLFTQADGGSEVFNNYAAELAAALFPGRELRDLPADSELYSTMYPMEDRPPLKAVSNGSRLLMVHSPQDLAQAWQQRAEQSRRAAFQFGVNLFVYATGKAEPVNRLASPYVPDPPAATGGRVRVARLRYGGNWDPEPGGWRRLARVFQWETGVAVETSNVDLEQLSAWTGPLAHLTGTEARDFTEAEVISCRQYVQDGGVLLIDSCGGSFSFDATRHKLLSAVFAKARSLPAGADHPLLRAATAAGMRDLPTPALRPFVGRSGGGPSGATALEVLKYGNGHVVSTALDLSTALAGARSWGVAGYEPASADALVMNLILWAAAGQPDGRGFSAGERAK